MSIFLVLVLFLILSSIIYQILSRNKEIINRILEKQLFKRIAEVYSHGGIHVILLLIIFACICILLYNNEKLTKTVTHNIIIDVDDSMNDFEGRDYRSPGVHFDLYLNNDSIKKETNYKFKDALDVTVRSYCMKENTSVADINILHFPYNGNIDTKYIDTIISQKVKPIIRDSMEILKIRTDLINGALVPGIHKYLQQRKIRIYCNDFGVQEDNPYYYYSIKFKLPERDSLISGKYSFSIQLDSVKYDTRFDYYTKKQIWIKEISPEPDIRTNGYIHYYTDKTIDEIRNRGGIFLEAEDIEVTNRMRQKEFQNSVLIGTCLAFALDIIIQLIIKLRNLNREHERDSKNRSELLLIENMEKKEDDEEQQQETNGIE
jgi:hypothetical protein